MTTAAATGHMLCGTLLLAVGDRVGPYRVLAPLGAGGMGEVYRAHDERLGREVALKLLRSGEAVIPAGDRERFWREARAAAAVSHPGICPLYDVGEEAGVPWLAMELLAGEPLEAVIARGPLAPTRALGVMGEVLRALAAVHARGIVHRDLKPSNVFVTAHGTRLLDFGLALPTSGFGDGDPRLTRSGLLVGTPRYMAPEQWRGEPVGPATDVFACGALLFEMLTGGPAFAGATVADLCQAILASEPPALVGDAAVIGIDRLLQRAMAKVPSARFADAAAMLAALDAVATTATGAAQLVQVARVRPLERLLVLPFRLLRADPEIEFLSLALAEAVAAELGGLGHLAVRSPRAGARFAEQSDLGVVAREAEVDLLLAGSLLRAGRRVRLQAQLLSLPDGTVKASALAEADFDDLFALVDELAGRVCTALRLPLAPREEARMGAVPAVGAAYELYLRAGNVSLSAARGSSLRAAAELYRQCVELDPGFAPAWAQLGRTHRLLGKFGHADGAECRRLSAQAFERALALGPELPLVHNLYTYFELEEAASAPRAMLRLLGRIAHQGADAELFAGLVTACRFCGLFDASLAAHERARRLDPARRTSVAYTWWAMGDYERAAALDDEPLPFMRMYAWASLGREAEVAAECDGWRARLDTGLELTFAEATRGAVLGERETVARAARSLASSAFRDPEGIYFIARAAARVGEHELALDALERVVAGGFSIPDTLRRDGWLDGLREAPRFVALLATAEAARRHAAELFVGADGPRLLGVTDPLSGSSSHPDATLRLASAPPGGPLSQGV